MKKIDTVIFDIGKVLVDFYPLDVIKELGFPEDIITVFREKIFSGLWYSYDRGRHDKDEVLNSFKEQVPGLENYVDIIWDNLAAFLPMRPYAPEWVRSVREQGYKVYILSNFGYWSFKELSPSYDFLKHIDGALISFETEHMKPEPEIYRILFDRFGIDPETAVFLDDSTANIETAVRLGLRGIVFEDHKQGSEALKTMLAACGEMG